MASTVYIYNPVGTAMAESFCTDIRKRVETTRVILGVQYGCPKMIGETAPLLVVCYNHSRIGTDIDSSLSALKGYNKRDVAVLVIHCKEPHALPQTMPTDTLTDVKYDEFGKLIDFAVSPGNYALYECNMNGTGFFKLNEFLDHYCGRRDRTFNQEQRSECQDTPLSSQGNQQRLLASNITSLADRFHDGFNKLKGIMLSIKNTVDSTDFRMKRLEEEMNEIKESNKVLVESNTRLSENVSSLYDMVVHLVKELKTSEEKRANLEAQSQRDNLQHEPRNESMEGMESK